MHRSIRPPAISTGQVARCGGGTAGSVAGGMIGYNIERSSDANCVKDYEAQGFRRSSEAGSADLQQQPAQGRGDFRPAAAPTGPGATPAVAGIRGESKYFIAAEGVAKAVGCAPPSVALSAKGAGSESFTVGCPNGTTLAIRCEVDGCRILR